ncbi:MAG TPA: tetratricopeptide repeat protein [Deltaproteobacteria bacterium]|nr:tetratricopeptide repeat protein [Deltaproteobacteria bacterium]
MRKDKDRYWDCLDQAMEASHGGRIEEALAWLDEALRVHPDGAEAHNGRGEILWDDGRVDEALIEFDRATIADGKFTAAHLNRIELLIEELGEFGTAARLSDELLSGRPELPRPDRMLQAEVYYLKSKALFYQDDLEGALFLVRRASKAGGELGLYCAFEGQVLFELGAYQEAKRVLERGAAIDPDSAHTLYHLGLVLERLEAEGEASGATGAGIEGAAEAFARANSLEPQQFPMPLDVSETAFAKAVDTAMANLPRSIRERIEGVPILVEDFPDLDLVRNERVSPQTLGLFLGVPRTEVLQTDQPLDLDRILLFKKNLEKICQDEEDLIDQVQITLRHEVGHYLGLDEDDLERLGLG